MKLTKVVSAGDYATVLCRAFDLIQSPKLANVCAESTHYNYTAGGHVSSRLESDTQERFWLYFIEAPSDALYQAICRKTYRDV